MNRNGTPRGEIRCEIDPAGSGLGRVAGFCKHDNEVIGYVS
jgi:hypothetical protein